MSASSLLPLVVALLATSHSPVGAAFGQAGSIAVVQVELLAGPGILFNHRGPSRLQLAWPLGPPVEQRVARGTPLDSDPDNYDISVPPLRFEIRLPIDAQPGDYPLQVTGELYLCDSVKHACFRSQYSAQTTLHVGAVGREVPVRIELLKPGGSVRSPSPRNP